MARGNRPIEIRADDETRDRWTAAARDAGQTLASFIRDTVEAALSNGASLARPPRAKADAVRGARAPKAQAGCERERFHRPGTFCKSCGKSW